MAQDLPLESTLDLAIHRLDQALATLEARIAARAAQQAEDENGDLFAAADHEADRARLAAELDAARSREKALEEVAAEASAALGRAAAEVRAALAAGES
jgi:hypothetical protein